MTRKKLLLFMAAGVCGLSVCLFVLFGAAPGSRREARVAGEVDALIRDGRHKDAYERSLFLPQDRNGQPESWTNAERAAWLPSFLEKLREAGLDEQREYIADEESARYHALVYRYLADIALRADDLRRDGDIPELARVLRLLQDLDRELTGKERPWQSVARRAAEERRGPGKFPFDLPPVPPGTPPR